MSHLFSAAASLSRSSLTWAKVRPPEAEICRFCSTCPTKNEKKNRATTKAQGTSRSHVFLSVLGRDATVPLFLSSRAREAFVLRLKG